jgi:hypothetical protein
MLLSRHKNEGQNCDIKTANKSFENVTELKYFGTTITNQKWIQHEIQRRLISGNAYNHSIQKLLPFRLLLKIVKIRIYKTVIWLSFFLVVYVGL